MGSRERRSDRRRASNPPTRDHPDPGGAPGSGAVAAVGLDLSLNRNEPMSLHDRRFHVVSGSAAADARPRGRRGHDRDAGLRRDEEPHRRLGSFHCHGAADAPVDRRGS